MPYAPSGYITNTTFSPLYESDPAAYKRTSVLYLHTIPQFWTMLVTRRDVYWMEDGGEREENRT